MNQPEPRPTVFIVDDDADIRQSLHWLLESVRLPARTFASAQELLDARIAGQPGCLVLDVRMPGMSGLDLQAMLGQAGIHLPVIIITGHADVPMAVRALKGGAFDFIEKPFSDQVLLDRIQRAIELDAQRRSRRATREMIESRLRRLTSREFEVMELVVAGKSNKAIAAAMGLSPKTIEVHRAHVMEKMEAASVAELVRLYMQVSNGEGLAVAQA